MLQRVGEPFDAAITTGAGFPLDLTFYQSVKGVTAAAGIVRPGGRILLFGECAEGAGAAEFRQMMTQLPLGRRFPAGHRGAPVTIDQWQLEKLALSDAKGRGVLLRAGVAGALHASLVGSGFRDPGRLIAAFFKGLAPGSRVAVIPEGPYVLAAPGQRSQ